MLLVDRDTDGTTADPDRRENGGASSETSWGSAGNDVSEFVVDERMLQEARRLVGPDDNEDLLQDVALHILYLMKQGGLSVRNPRALFGKAVRRKAIDWIRKRQRAKVVYDQDVVDTATSRDQPGAEEVRDRVAAAQLNRLSRRERQVYDLRTCGTPPAEIAAILRISVSTANHYYSLAKLKLGLR